MALGKISSCRECKYARYCGNGEFFCDIMQLTVIVTDVPSEYHFACKSKNGGSPAEPKTIAQLDLSSRLVRTFTSVDEAAEHTGIPQYAIRSCLARRQRQTHGYKWVYTEREMR